MTESVSQSPMIWVYRLDGQGGATRLDPDQPAFQSGLRFESPELFWQHWRYDVDRTEQLLVAQGLSESVVEALIAHETRPRCVVMESGTLIVLRGINTHPDQDPEDMISLRLWCTPKGIISTRKSGRRLLSLIDLTESFDSGTGPRTVGEFLVFLTERLAARIGEFLEAINERLQAVEESLITDEMARQRANLAEIRRQSAAIKRYLAPQRDALEALCRSRDLLSEADTFDLRNLTDRVVRYVEDLELCRERAVVMQDELRNRLAEQQNERMYVLSLVTAIFLPLSFLTGVFGMNVGGLPGTESGSAFGWLAIFMFMVAIGLWGLLRWKRWM